MLKGSSQGHHILVIDDSEVMLARIKKALVADGHTVTTTTQTVGTARYLASCDLVVIDYHMPGINGLAVLEQLRGAAAQLERQPLFYLYTSDPKVTASLARGFDGYFTNKGDEQLLIQQVRAVFRLSQIRAMAARPRRTSAPPGAPDSAPPSESLRRAPPSESLRPVRPSESMRPAPPESRSKLSIPPPAPETTTRRKA